MRVLTTFFLAACIFGAGVLHAEVAVEAEASAVTESAAVQLESPKVEIDAPQVQPEATPAPLAVELRLKDGQSSKVDVLSHDSVFLEARTAAGRSIFIPWSLVASIKPVDEALDIQDLQARITREPSDLKLALAPRDPGKAFRAALWPGIYLHGAGHREAGKPEVFISLLGGELFGLLVSAFGALEMGENGNQTSTSQQLVAGGAAVFALTWIWDLALAPGAARSYNEEHKLSLLPTQDGFKLALRF